MTSPPTGKHLEDNFFRLTPERILDAVESAGFRCTGRCLALNSMENRVFEVEFEPDHDGDAPQQKHFVIAKFYRPGRWNATQILEEHEFLYDLIANDIPAVAPLPLNDGTSLGRLEDSDIMFAVFPKQGGRQPDELTDEQLMIVGRLLARLHRVGASKAAHARLRLTPQTFGSDNLSILQRGRYIPAPYADTYGQVVEQLVSTITPLFEAEQSSYQRVHGDCHPGNLIYGQQGFAWVDFDDMVAAPPVQDLWLLLPGRDQEARRQLHIMLAAYEEWQPFRRSSLRLIEPLRALRMVHFNTWLAKRWHDPAFPRAFPHFAEPSYWQRTCSDLQNQLQHILYEIEQQQTFWQ